MTKSLSAAALMRFSMTDHGVRRSDRDMVQKSWPSGAPARAAAACMAEMPGAISMEIGPRRRSARRYQGIRRQGSPWHRYRHRRGHESDIAALGSQVERLPYPVFLRAEGVPGTDPCHRSGRIRGQGRDRNRQPHRRRPGPVRHGGSASPAFPDRSRQSQAIPAPVRCRQDR